MLLVLDSGQYTPLHHTGRYFHGQVTLAGYDGEEIGISDVPDDPGYWVFEKGKPWSWTPYESTYPEDSGIGGTFRKPTFEDFEKANIECPIAMRSIVYQICKHLQKLLK